jgi:hypothetical protein
VHSGADRVILFAESHTDSSPAGPYFGAIRRHPLYREFPDKCFVHSGADRVIPYLPGVFPSIEKRFASHARARSGPYLVNRNPYLRCTPLDENCRWLAGFVGCAKIHKLRRRVLAMKDARILLRNTRNEFIGSLRQGDAQTHNYLKAQFVDDMLECKFVLCPRGGGTSSFRLFEAMEMGRVPVILSDQWLEPGGPDWPAFSIRVRERDLDRLPRILRDLEPQAGQMGRAARQAWESFYADDRIFGTLAHTCLDMLACRTIPEAVARRIVHYQRLHPRQLKAEIHRRRTAIRSKLRGLLSAKPVDHPVFDDEPSVGLAGNSGDEVT